MRIAKQILMSLALFALIFVNQPLNVVRGETLKNKAPVFNGASTLDHIAEDIYNTLHANTIRKRASNLVANSKIIFTETEKSDTRMLITLSQHSKALLGIIRAGTREIFVWLQDFGAALALRLKGGSVYFSENQVINQGIIAFPSTGNSALDSATVAKLSETFSDEIIVVSGSDNDPPIIRPVFRDTIGEGYLYLVVPLNQ
jgi:hypothetical protein